MARPRRRVRFWNGPWVVEPAGRRIPTDELLKEARRLSDEQDDIENEQYDDEHDEWEDDE